MPTFVVLAHREPALLARLVGRLSPDPVVVHIDAAQDPAPFRAALASFSNVSILDHPVEVHWGGMSVVDATLRAFAAASALTSDDEHVVLLSGQCYPIRPLADLRSFLQQSPIRQHIKAARVFGEQGYSDERLRLRWFYDQFPYRPGTRARAPMSAVRKTLTTVAPRRAEEDFLPLTPCAGSQWVALTGECVRHVLGATTPKTRGLFRFAKAPDEIYLHTLVHSSHWTDQTQTPSPGARLGRRTSDFANLHFLDPSQTRVFTEADFAELVASGYYFVRKVSSTDSGRLMDQLDAEHA